MTKFEITDNIRKKLIELLISQKEFDDNDEAAFQAFKKAYWNLVQRFYQDNSELMAYPQYEASQEDPEYFLSLVVSACEYHKKEEKENAKVLH